MSSENDVVAALNEFVQASVMGMVNTSIPGIIEKYDQATHKAIVTPMISKKFADGSYLKYKPISNVPVIFPRTKSSGITFPILKGDTVLLIISQASLDEWLTVGGEVDPVSDSMYEIHDAMAYPGLMPFSVCSMLNDSKTKDVLEITHHDTKITIEDGKVLMGKALLPLDGVVTGQCKCAFTGLPHPDFSSVVRSEK